LNFRLLDTSLLIDKSGDRHFPDDGDQAVRPNKAQVMVAIYEAKLARWPEQWPELTYLDWDAPTVL
jgi:hypothetical protein